MKTSTIQGRSKLIILSNEQSFNIINNIQSAFIVPVTNRSIIKSKSYLYVKNVEYIHGFNIDSITNGGEPIF